MENKKTGTLRKMVFWCYIAAVIKLIIFKYPYEHLRQIAANWEKGVILEGLATANFTPGKSIRMYIHYFSRINGFPNLIGNVLIFIPFGYLLPQCFPPLRKWWKVFGIALLFIAGIEFFQLFSAFGAFDVDDIILNGLGAVIGYVVYLFRRTSREDLSE